MVRRFGGRTLLESRRVRDAIPGLSTFPTRLRTDTTHSNLCTKLVNMSLDEWLDGSRDIVDPEVRAYVGSLVNAVRLKLPSLALLLTL